MKQYVVPYFFHPELRWSDGQPLKQADIELAYRHDCDPAAESFIERTCAAIATVVTANTAYTVTYKPGYQDPGYFKPPFLFYPSHQVILSAGPYQGKTLAEVPTAGWFSLPEIMEQPIGVGPYRLKSWRKGAEMVFEQNPYYWRGASTLHFQQIRVVFDLPFDDAVQQLEAGTLHVLPDLQTTSSPDVTVYKVASATWEHMDMNLELYRQAVARHLPASGGVLAAAGGISVTVPPGATAAGADFVLNDIAAPTQEFDDAQVPVRAFTLQAFDGAGQPITHFAQPLTIQVTYTDEALQALGLDENSLNVAYWDGTAWDRVLPCAGCTVDRAANRVTFTVSHLTEFALTASTESVLAVRADAVSRMVQFVSWPGSSQRSCRRSSSKIKGACLAQHAVIQVTLPRHPLACVRHVQVRLLRPLFHHGNDFAGILDDDDCPSKVAEGYPFFLRDMPPAKRYHAALRPSTRAGIPMPVAMQENEFNSADGNMPVCRSENGMRAEWEVAVHASSPVLGFLSMNRRGRINIRYTSPLIIAPIGTSRLTSHLPGT